MRLSLQTDYALRTLIFLAGKPGRHSIQQVSDFYAISKDHVAKTVRRLGQLGYIRNLRGAGGGIELLKRAEEISIGQVILDFEGNMNLLECVTLENVCVIQPGCKLRHVLIEAERLQREYLNSVRLSEVVSPAGQLVELLLPSGNSSSEGELS
jgi:Rrf2 family nitric oxide-sensitive transcriptional repressor